MQPWPVVLTPTPWSQTALLIRRTSDLHVFPNINTLKCIYTSWLWKIVASIWLTRVSKWLYCHVSNTISGHNIINAKTLKVLFMRGCNHDNKDKWQFKEGIYLFSHWTFGESKPRQCCLACTKKYIYYYYYYSLCFSYKYNFSIYCSFILLIKNVQVH